MAIDYNKYISRLKARRERDPQYEATRLNTFRAIEPARAMTREVSGTLGKQGASVGAQAQLLQDSNQQMSNILGTVPSAPDTSQIDNQIMTLEMQRDQEKQTGKDNALKTGLQIGGTVLGAAVGSVVPGAGTMLGAQIGAGLGDAASGFVGGGGKMGFNYTNPEQVARGFADTIEGISSAVSLKQHREVAKRLGGGFEKLKQSGMMESAYMAILSKDFDLLNSILTQAEAWAPAPAIADETSAPGPTPPAEGSDSIPGPPDAGDMLRNQLKGLRKARVELEGVRNEMRDNIEQSPGTPPSQPAEVPRALSQIISNYGTGNDVYYSRKFNEYLAAKAENQQLSLDDWLSSQRIRTAVKDAMRGMWRNYNGQ